MTSWASPTDGSSASATPGMRLGDRYELKQPIASGGMAQVWSATDTLLDRAVAIKVLHPHLATDDAFVERFRREAVAAASLSHSSIVSIYDTISENGLEAIVMELIEGRTLRTILDEIGAMPAADVVHFGMRIASALDEAHRAGIVHRDVKPANIMICPDRRVMVTDFGIAKAGSDVDLTQTGTLLGTAKYLAPEQVSGAPVDPRSDLYALGVVMFEALTGSAPFKANTDAATALARLHQDPPLVRSLRPNVSIELADVVGRLMSRDPNRRYPRARVLRETLASISAATGDPNEPVTNPSERPTPPLPPGSSPTAGQPPAAPIVTAATAPAAPHPRPPDPPGAMHPPGSIDPSGGNNRPGSTVGSGSSNPPGYAPAVTGPAPPGLYQAGPPADRASRPPAPPSTQAAHRGATPGAGSPGSGQQPFEVLGVDPASSGTSSISTGRVVRSGRSRVLPVLVIGSIVVGLVAAGTLLTDVGAMMGIGESVATNPLDEVGPGLEITELRSFDPQSLDEVKLENEELTSLAADDDLATSWTTEPYRRRELGGLKEGVGLLIEIDERLPLNRIELDTNTEGWVAEIYVGDAFADDGSDWGEPVATVDSGSNRVVRELNRAEGRVVLLWLRDTGVTGERFRFELAEVVLR